MGRRSELLCCNISYAIALVIKIIARRWIHNEIELNLYACKLQVSSYLCIFITAFFYNCFFDAIDILWLINHRDVRTNWHSWLCSDSVIQHDILELIFRLDILATQEITHIGNYIDMVSTRFDIELIVSNMLLYHHACQWRRKILCYELTFTIYRKGVEAKIINLAFIYRGIIGRNLRGTAA